MMKKIEDIAVRYKHSNLISASLEFIFMILSLTCFFKLIYIYKYMNNLSFIYSLLLFIFGIITLVIIIFRLCNYKKIESIFSTLIICIGLSYLVFIIPNQVADEDTHYASIYGILSGDIFNFGSKASVPNQMLDNGVLVIDTYEELNEMLKLDANFTDVTAVRTSGYATIFYAPAVIGVGIGKITNMSLFIGYYLGRILTFIAFIILGFLAIKLIPFGKIVLFTYLLSPMSIHQSISLSADSLMNGFIIFFIAFVLKLLHDKEYFKNNEKRSLIVLCISTVIVGLSKYVYLPICLLSLLLLGKNQFKKYKKEIIGFFSIAVIMCLGLFVYSMFFKASDDRLYLVENNISAVGQLKYLLSNPISIIKVLINTVIVSGATYIDSFAGMYLGWLNIGINRLLIYLYLFTLIISIFVAKDDTEPKKIESFFLISISILVSLFVIFGMYLTWSPVGNNIAVGVQGRYFIPVIIMFLLGIVKKNRDMKINNYVAKISFMLLFINICSIFTIIKFFV